MTPTLKAKLREELGSLTSDAKLDRVYRAVLEGIREDPPAPPFEATVYNDGPYAEQEVRRIFRAYLDALLSQGEAVE